jgi:flagellar protein FliS
MTAAAAAYYEAYKKVNVETASQGKLIVMLFNGAIQRAEEAKRQMQRNNLTEVHNNLVRAQEIVGELRGALNMKAGEVSENLDRIYEYFTNLLIRANIKKDPVPVDEFLELATMIRDTWQELFEGLAKDSKPTTPAPPVNQHGASLMNLQG